MGIAAAVVSWFAKASEVHHCGKSSPGTHPRRSILQERRRRKPRFLIIKIDKIYLHSAARPLKKTFSDIVCAENHRSANPMKTPTPPRSFPLNQNTTIRVLLVAAASLLAPRLPASAQTSIPVPNFSFETYSQYYSGSTYTNQQLDTPDGYSPFPVVDVKGG